MDEDKRIDFSVEKQIEGYKVPPDEGEQVNQIVSESIYKLRLRLVDMQKTLNHVMVIASKYKHYQRDYEDILEITERIKKIKQEILILENYGT